MAETSKTQEKRWDMRELRQDLGLALASCLNISPLVAQVLINRGIETPEAAQSFLSARLTDLHSPFLMKDMGRATERIAAAMAKKEKICICGDYDVDGITATTVILLFLESAGAQVAFHIPSRLTEGYGMSMATVKKLHADGVSLIITVDCGVSAFDEVACARAHGIDVIVTDHHEPPDQLPEAYAIINPKQLDCPFPFKGLAGVGVAFNLVMALRTKLRDNRFWQNGQEPNLKKYLDLVALGTIADMVPMLDENRIFVRNGLEILGQGCRPGIKALKNVCGIPDGPVAANMIGFRLAPRLNAAGRMAEADLSVRLLRTGNDDEAMAMARKIDEENTRRQQRERSILSEARNMVKQYDELPDSLILSSPGWHPGVIGLCASRLSEEFSRPAILFAVDEKSGECKGSARTVKGFDLYGAIKKCSSMLKAFGGHRDAAGLTVHMDKMDLFMQAFNAIVREQFAANDFSPMLAIDAEIPLGELSHTMLEQIQSLAPFGPGNAEPVFSSREHKILQLHGCGQWPPEAENQGRRPVLRRYRLQYGGPLQSEQRGNPPGLCPAVQCLQWPEARAAQSSGH